MATENRLLHLTRTMQDKWKEMEQERRNLFRKEMNYLEQIRLLAAEVEDMVERLDAAAAREEELRKRITDVEIDQNNVRIAIKNIVKTQKTVMESGREGRSGK